MHTNCPASVFVSTGGWQGKGRRGEEWRGVEGEKGGVEGGKSGRGGVEGRGVEGGGVEVEKGGVKGGEGRRGRRGVNGTL